MRPGVGAQDDVIGQSRVTTSSAGECGVWDLRALCGELAAEVRDIVQQTLF